MLKSTSQVVVIGYFELLTSAHRVYSQNFQTIPLLIVVAAYYLALTSVLSIGQGSSSGVSGAVSYRRSRVWGSCVRRRGGRPHA